MKQLLAIATLYGALVACAPDTRSDAERLAQAARADSSAAGYDVGGSGAPADPRIVAVSSTRPRSRAPVETSTVASHAGGPSHGAQRPDSHTVDSTPRHGGSPGGTADTAGGRGRGSSTTTGRGGSTSTTIPALDPVHEADFLTYDTTQKTLTFHLAAGDELPGRVSFNASTRGGRILTVPLGWRVTVSFANRDPDLPHSATVVAVTGTPPEELPAPAFPRAETVRAQEGLLEGGTDEITFVADREGRFLLACAVLAHAQRGQWISLIVAPDSSRPSYR
jgi:hypothetical protein